MLQALIIKADRLAAEAICQHLRAIDPAVTCFVAQRIDEARAILARTAINLLLTGITIPDGDVIDFLSCESGSPSATYQTLVVTAQRAPRLLASLASVSVDGAFDSVVDEPANLGVALRALGDGRIYWSPSFSRVLSVGPGRTILRQLSPTEQLVLAIIGTGSTDREAADQLGLRPSSIQTVRRGLHGKLGVHEKGDLMRIAAHLGFVRFVGDCVMPLGIDVLRKEYYRQSKRPIASRPYPSPVSANAPIAA